MRCLFTERRVKFGAHAVNHAGALLSLPVVRLCTVSAFVISLCCCLRDGPRKAERARDQPRLVSWPRPELVVPPS